MKFIHHPILSRYSSLSFGQRVFLILRWLWTPYEKFAAELPEKGILADFCSGYGLLSITLALNSPLRSVEGFDHDEPRIQISKQASGNLQNIRFSVGDLSQIDSLNLSPNYDGIAVIDSMHYFTETIQRKILKSLSDHLKSDGTLLIREVDKSDNPFSFWNRIHEFFMTKIGFTKAHTLHFRSKKEWHSLLQSLGFQVTSQKCSRFPFNDILFVCRFSNGGKGS